MDKPVLGGVATYGAVEWLRKALKRCELQAEEEGKSVEEVAAERHGVSEYSAYRVNLYSFNS